jgi:hypothetical protein
VANLTHTVVGHVGRGATLLRRAATVPAMDRDRAERITLIEAAFRVANDRMAAWEETPGEQPQLFFCECSDLECRDKVPLMRGEYDEIRRSSERFVVVPGHEVDDVEEVVDDRGTHNVILKPAAVWHLTRGTDPRADEPGEGRAEAEELATEVAPELPDPPDPPDPN